MSGLTLQSGPSRVVKDEYSAGAVVSTGGMDIDGSDLGTIQHHPQSVYGYSSAGKFFFNFFLFIFFLRRIFYLFLFLFFFLLNIGDPNQLGAMYPGRAVPKLEPSETQRSSWMAPPPPRIPTHSICKIFFIFLFDFIFLKALNFDYDL